MSLKWENKHERSNSNEERHSISSTRPRIDQPISDIERQQIAAAFRANHNPPNGWPAGMQVVESNGRMLSDPFECAVCADPDTLSNPRELYARGGHVRFPCDHRMCWPHAAEYQAKLYRDNPNNSNLLCAMCRNPNHSNQLQYEPIPRVPGSHSAPLRTNVGLIQRLDNLVASQPTRLVQDIVVPEGRGMYRYVDPLTRREITWPDCEWEDCIQKTLHAPTDAQVWFMCRSQIPHRVSAQCFDEMYAVYRRMGRYVDPIDHEVNQCFFCQRKPCLPIRVPQGAAQYVHPS